MIDSDTLVILMLAIGIGVDDTIHILMRYRIESSRCSSRAEAIKQTFAFSGRAIVMTTLILAIGFAPMAMTTYYSMNIMGSLLPATLVVAMVADLLLVLPWPVAGCDSGWRSWVSRAERPSNQVFQRVASRR